MEDFDLELFNRCLIEQPARAWDEYEASLAIATLGVCSIEAGEFETDELIRVELGVFGNRTTTVWLNIPRRREIVEFSRAAVKTVTTTKASETRVNLEPSARLFDSVFVKAEGYAEGSAIPVPHKDVAIVKLLELVNGANGGEA
jgi:hypothetical protein